MELFTSGEAAKQIGKSVASVRRAASRLGITRTVGGRLAILSSEIPRIAAEIGGVGNPNMIAGNDLWRLRKKPKKSRKQAR